MNIRQIYTYCISSMVLFCASLVIIPGLAAVDKVSAVKGNSFDESAIVVVVNETSHLSVVHFSSDSLSQKLLG